jgi:hypothetical protein
MSVLSLGVRSRNRAYFSDCLCTTATYAPRLHLARGQHLVAGQHLRVPLRTALAASRHQRWHTPRAYMKTHIRRSTSFNQRSTAPEMSATGRRRSGLSRSSAAALLSAASRRVRALGSPVVPP